MSSHFVPFDLRERHPVALDEILDQRQKLDAFWDALQHSVDYSIRENGGESINAEALKRKKKRNSQIIKMETIFALKETARSSYLFEPTDQWKLFWDLLIGVLIMYSIIMIPYRLGFLIKVGSDAILFDTIMDFIFLADVAISFNTAYTDPVTELLVVNRKAIALNYLKFWFWVDLISAVDLASLLRLFSDGEFSTIFRTSRLLKILRLMRITKVLRMFRLERLSSMIENLNINPIIFGIQRILIILVLVASAFPILAGVGWIVNKCNSYFGYDKKTAKLEEKKE